MSMPRLRATDSSLPYNSSLQKKQRLGCSRDIRMLQFICANDLVIKTEVLNNADRFRRFDKKADSLTVR